MSKQKEKYFIVAAGGYLPKPVVEEIVVDETEMDKEFDDFDEYKPTCCRRLRQSSTRGLPNQSS